MSVPLKKGAGGDVNATCTNFIIPIRLRICMQHTCNILLPIFWHNFVAVKKCGINTCHTACSTLASSHLASLCMYTVRVQYPQIMHLLSENSNSNCSVH